MKHSSEITLVLQNHGGSNGSAIFAALQAQGLTLYAVQSRTAQQFGERRFRDEFGNQALYCEDHILGLRLLALAGPSAAALQAALCRDFPIWNASQALNAATSAQTAAAQISTLGPLIVLLAYTALDADVEAAAYQLLESRLHAENATLRRATLYALAYLLSPQALALLEKALALPDLAEEAKRQLSQRTQLGAAANFDAQDAAVEESEESTPDDDYLAQLQQAEVARKAQKPLTALIQARIAMALARRLGVDLAKLLALTQTLRSELSAAPTTESSDIALLPLQRLFDSEYFYEVEEVAWMLLQDAPHLPADCLAALRKFYAQAQSSRGARPLR